GRRRDGRRWTEDRRRRLDGLDRRLALEPNPAGLRGRLLPALGRALLPRLGPLARRGDLHGFLGRLFGLPGAPGPWLSASVSTAAELHAKLVGNRGGQRARRAHALVPHSLERHDQVLAGDTQFLRQIHDLHTSCHSSYLLAQNSTIAAALSRGGFTAPFS